MKVTFLRPPPPPVSGVYPANVENMVSS